MTKTILSSGARIGAQGCIVALSIALAAVACREIADPVPTLDFISVQSEKLVEVNDTVHVKAAGLGSSSMGLSDDALLDARWSLSDPAIASLTVLPRESGDSYARAIFRGLQPGVAGVTVSARGVSGVDSIRVIPVLDRIAVQSARDTIAVGDTIDVAITAFDGTGQPVPDLPFTYGYSGEVRVISYSKTGMRIVAQSTGVAVVTAQVRRMSGRTSFVVIPRAP